MIELREITKDNYEDCLNLSVEEDQKSYVASNTYSLAQAYIFRKTAYPFAIYSDDTIIGFIMLGYYEDKSCYTLWRFMIDKKYQNKGYGKQALLLGIDYLKHTFRVKEIFTSVVPENIYAKRLYKSIGFIETGELSGCEIVMKLDLI